MTPQELFEIIPEETLWSQYFGITTVPCKINAPYRQDNNPSLSIFLNKDKKIRFKDFGTNQSGDILTLLSLVWEIPVNKVVNRIMAVVKKYKNGTVVKDLSYWTKIVYNPPHPIIRTHVKSDLKVRIREWRDYDIAYWKSYGISLNWLKFGQVYPISTIFFTNSEGDLKSYPAEKYAYCYVEKKDNLVTLKVYQPFSKTHKWTSKHDASVWDLWSQLPKEGEKLIITSSRKDALCIWENTGIPSVALQGEGYIPKKHVVEQLKHRFKKVFVLYDNDFQADENYGEKDAKKICEMFDLKQIEIPESYRAKDPSDLVKIHGIETLQHIINELTNENTKSNV